MTAWRNFDLNGFILRDASLRAAPQDEASGEATMIRVGLKTL
jgi:hypothetical protein